MRKPKLLGDSTVHPPAYVMDERDRIRVFLPKPSKSGQMPGGFQNPPINDQPMSK